MTPSLFFERCPLQTARSGPRAPCWALLAAFALSHPWALAERASQEHDDTQLAFDGTGLNAFTRMDNTVHNSVLTHRHLQTDQSSKVSGVALAQMSADALDSGKAPVVMTFETAEGVMKDITLTKSPFGMTYAAGAFPLVIQKVEKGMPAEAAGVQLQMKVVKVDGVDVGTTFAVADKLVKDSSARLRSQSQSPSGPLAVTNGASNPGPSRAERRDANEEKLRKLALITPEMLKTEWTTAKAAAPAQETAWDAERIADTDPNPHWRDLLKAHESQRDDKSFKYYKGLLNGVANKVGLTKDIEYTDFYSKVQSIHPGHIDKVIEDAHEVADQNHDANEKSYQYIDDLEKLANGTAMGYNKMATSQFFAYDQIFGQLSEGKMAPGMSVKMTFPFGGDVKFEPNSGVLKSSSRDYFTTEFARRVKEKLQHYHGFHFTICVHSSTNLDARDMPRNYSTDAADREMEKQPNGMSIRVGLKRLLQEREASLQKEIVEMFTNAMGDLHLSRSDYHFPAPSADNLHFDSMMPAGLVLVIAEDRLHRDDFQGATEEEAEAHAKEVEKFDQTKCKVEDFNAMKTQEDLESFAQPLEQEAPFYNLPTDPREENRDTAADKNRLSSKALVTWVEANAKLPQEEQLAHSDELVKALAEARTEQSKYAKVIEHREKLGDNSTSSTSGVLSSLTSGLTNLMGGSSGDSGSTDTSGSTALVTAT